MVWLIFVTPFYVVILMNNKFLEAFDKYASAWGMAKAVVNKGAKNMDNVLDYKKINPAMPKPPVPKHTLDYSTMKAPTQPPMWKQKMEASSAMKPKKSFPGVIDDVSKNISRV